MKNSIRLFTTILIVGVVLQSCKKDEEIKNPVDTASSLKQTTEDHNMLDGEFNSVFNTVDNLANDDTSISGKVNITILPLCATKSFDVATKTLVVDFGTINCLCNDGLNRRGKIIAVFDGKYRTKGTKVTVTLDNYFVEDIQFKGTKTIENLGNASGNFKYSYKVIDAEAITQTGTISWETNAIVERVQGDSTFTPWDDIYEATGSSAGVNRAGTNFTVDIDPNKPLTRKISIDPLCWRNFVSGVLTINDDKSNVFVLDYDPTNEQKCDKEAQLIINGGKPVKIYLR